MGRSIYSDHLKTQPPGFFLEVNNSLLEGLWAALALEKHPEIADEPHEVERTFELCKHVTWADFWRAFPYKLREGGSYLDELDALGLLLSSSVSKQRFQRYFEQYAYSQSSSSIPGTVQINSSTPTMQDAAQQQQQQQRQNPTAFRLGLRLDQMSDGEMRRAVIPGRHRGQYPPLLQPQQQQQRQEPRQRSAVRFPTAAAGGAAADPVAYVPPPARPLLPPAAAAAAAGRSRPATAAGSSRAAAAVARTAAAAAAAARLSGRRRTWTEVCEETAPPAPDVAALTGLLVNPQQSNAALAAATTAAAAEEEPPAGPSAAPAPAGGLGNTHSPELNNSNMWRAVHDWLTADDEALLGIVSRLVPYKFEGLLRDTASVREQLQQLADSRPVTDKVVQAISDRLSATSDSNLIRLTASSGYSRRAAAAAAALACSDRAPFYISLAGLYKEEDLEAAILEGLFGENLSRSGTPDNPEDTAAAAAAADLDAAVASVAQQMRDHPNDQPLNAGNAAAAAAILNAAAAARPQTVLEAVDAALTQNGQFRLRDPVGAEVERVRNMARQLQAAPAEVVVAATAEAAAAVTDLVAQFGPAAGRAAFEAEAEALIRATAAANAAAAGAAAAAGPGDNGAAALTPEERAAQLERDLGVEFEPGFSAQQRVRILQALTSRRQRRATAAAAAAETAAAAGAAADGNAGGVDLGFDRGMRARLLEAVEAHRERRAAAADPAAAAAGDVAQDRIAAALRMVRQRQQQQQHVSDSDSEVEEGLDRMYGMWADAAGLNLGPTGTTDHEVVTNRRRNTREVQTLDQPIYDDSDDEVPGLLVEGFNEESEEGSDDAADQGIWRIEAPNTEVRDWAQQTLDRRSLDRQPGVRMNYRNLIGRDAGATSGYRCGELLSAYLTLLGTCYKEPLLLLIDEADAALVAGEGLGFSQVLMRVLCMLPQAVIVLSCSYKSEIFGDASSALRQQGQDVQYALVDGTLNIACHRIPKTLYYRCFM